MACAYFQAVSIYSYKATQSHFRQLMTKEGGCILYCHVFCLWVIFKEHFRVVNERNILAELTAANYAHVRRPQIALPAVTVPVAL